jgi:hypothetical protein
MKEKIREILVKYNDNKERNDKAESELLDLFFVSKRYSLTYQDENDKEQKLKVMAQNDDEALDQLEKICPKATYIFISKY